MTVDVLSPYGCVVFEHCVTVGATVSEGQELIVVEAMKMMNTVAAPCAGTVTWLESPGTCVDAEATIGRITTED